MARKAKKVYSRKTNTGIAAAPTSSFTHFNDYIRLEVDKKEIVSTIKAFIKANFSKKDYRDAQAAPDWSFTATLASTIAWKALDKVFPDNWNSDWVIQEKCAEIIQRGIQKQEKKEENKDTTAKRTIADIVKERTSDFIGMIEEHIDAMSDVSVYDELKKIDAPNNTAKAVYDYYLPQRDEIKELVEKKTSDLVEAYNHMSKKEQKAYLKYLDNILTDAERYMASKKAQRKSRAPKVKSADAQVKNMNYLKESKEHKLVSIDPATIVGAQRVYLFNAKYRTITELVNMSPSGFEVSGSTIKGIDIEASRQVKLRKPEEFLSIVLKKTPNQINKDWSQLTTKSSSANGRVNKETIILRALDK